MYNEERTSSLINGVWKIGLIHANEWTRPLHYTRQKVNSKWIKDLPISPEIIKLLGK